MKHSNSCVQLMTFTSLTNTFISHLHAHYTAIARLHQGPEIMHQSHCASAVQLKSHLKQEDSVTRQTVQ